MGKILSVLGGIILIVIALGLLVFSPIKVLGVEINFLQSLIIMIEAVIPVVVGVFGLLLLFIGIEEMKSAPVAKEMPPAPEAPMEEKEPVYEIHKGKKKKR